MSVVFGYRHVAGVPPCPCRDPGNYMAMEQPGDDPLTVLFRCWCGRTMPAAFDSIEERGDFLKDQGIAQ